MIELAALDIAGTTLQEHGAVYAALEAAVRDAGAPVTAADVERHMGTAKHEAVRDLGPDATADAVERAYAAFRERLLAAYRERPPTPLPGVPAALAELRSRGIKVALTTGFERPIAEPLLASVGWDDGTIDALICSDDVRRGRPAPYMIFRAMEATGVADIRRVLVAGDTPADLRAGTNAGAAEVVGVLTGRLDAATLSAEPHTRLLASVAELPAHLA